MVITSSQICNLYEQCKLQRNLGEALRYGFVRKGDRLIDAYSLEGRLRRFLLGKSCYPTAKEALAAVSKALETVEIQGEREARALIELRQRIKPASKVTPHTLGAPLETLEKRLSVDPFAESILFTLSETSPLAAAQLPDIAPSKWYELFKKMGIATSNERRAMMLEKMHEDEASLRVELLSATPSEKKLKIRAAADDLRNRLVSTNEAWMLQGGAGRSGPSIHLLLSSLRQLITQDAIKETLVIPPKLLTILSTEDPVEALTSLIGEHLADFENELPMLSESEERLVAQITDVLVEKESRTLNSHLPRFIAHEMDALYKNGLLGSLVSFLSPELQSLFDEGNQLLLPLSEWDPEKPAVKKALELSVGLISTLAKAKSSKGEEILQRQLESLLNALPANYLAKTGCLDLMTKSPIYYTFSKEKEGTYNLTIHAAGALFLAHHQGGFPIKISGISESKLTTHFFEKLLSHHYLPEIDAKILSDPEALYSFLLNELGGKVEILKRKLPHNMRSAADLDRLLLTSAPEKLHLTLDDVRLNGWKSSITPYLNRKERTLKEIPPSEAKRLKEETNRFLSKLDDSSEYKLAARHLLALLPKEVSLTNHTPLGEWFSKLGLTKNRLQSHQETLIWLFGEEIEEQLQVLEELLPESIEEKEEVGRSIIEESSVAPTSHSKKTRPQRSATIRFLSSPLLSTALYLIQLNLKLAEIVKTFSFSLVDFGIPLIQTEIIKAILQEIIPTAILEWFCEMQVMLLRWVLSTTLRFLIKNVIPPKLITEFQHKFDIASNLIHKIAGKERLSFSVSGYTIPEEVENSVAPIPEEGTKFESNIIVPKLIHKDLSLLSEEEIFIYLNESLEMLKKGVLFARHFEPLMKSIGVPSHGKRNLSDQVENKEQLISLLHEIGKQIPTSCIANFDPHALLYFHQLIAHVDLIVTEKERPLVIEHNSKLRKGFNPFGYKPHETKLSLMRAPELLLGFTEMKMLLPGGDEQRLYRELMEYFYPEIDIEGFVATTLGIQSLLSFSPFSSCSRLFESSCNLFEKNRELRPKVLKKLIEYTDDYFYFPVNFVRTLEKHYLIPDEYVVKDELFSKEVKTQYIPKHLGQLVQMQLFSMGWSISYLISTNGKGHLPDVPAIIRFVEGVRKQSSFSLLDQLQSAILLMGGESPGVEEEKCAVSISTVKMPKRTIRDEELYGHKKDVGYTHLTEEELIIFNHPEDALLRTLELIRKKPITVNSQPFFNALKALFYEPGRSFRSPSLADCLEEWSLELISHFKSKDEVKEIINLFSFINLFYSAIEGENPGSCRTLFLTLYKKVDGVIPLSSTWLPLLPIDPTPEEVAIISPHYSALSNSLKSHERRAYFTQTSVWDQLLSVTVSEESKLQETVKTGAEATNKPVKIATLSLGEIESHGLNALTKLTDPSDILVTVEVGNSELTHFSLFDRQLSFKIAQGQAIAEGKFKGERIDEIQYHKALKGFPSYLILTASNGAKRAVIPSSALFGSLLHRGLSYLGYLEPFAQGMIQKLICEHRSTTSFFSVEISSSGDLLPSDSEAVLALFSHFLLQGEYEKAEKLFESLESLSRRREITINRLLLTSLATLIPTPRCDLQTLRLKLIALTYENELIQGGTSESEGSHLLFILQLFTDLNSIKSDAHSLSEREEWLLYEKLFSLASSLLGREFLSPLYSELLPAGMRNRYLELSQTFEMEGNRLIQMGAKGVRFFYSAKLPALGSLQSTLESALTGQKTFNHGQLLSFLSQGLDKLLPHYKGFELKDFLKPLLLLLPVWDSPIFTSSCHLKRDMPLLLLDDLVITDELFWPLYLLAFNERKDELKAWIQRRGGIGTARELAFLQILKAAVDHPYIMPDSWTLLDSDGDNSFRMNLFIPFAVATLSESAYGSFKNLLINRGKNWLLNKIPTFNPIAHPSTGELEAALYEPVNRLISYGVNALWKSDEKLEREASAERSCNRQKLRETDRKWSAPLKEIAAHLFSEEALPELPLKKIPGAESTRLEKSMLIPQTGKTLYRLKNQGELLKAYFTLTRLDSELSAEIIGREKRLSEFLEKSTKIVLPIRVWQQGLRRACTKRTSK